ncbi:cation:proton antiporter [Nafulsella turpanensis]|uniref:cation:proton antiporter n=1 Tax=Nafulsella turpanensis TaxID=1265690 RepID=UPI0003491A10|nr:cation:proton antiporter [Nafulsella turpanensis]
MELEKEFYNLAIILLGLAILGVTWLPNILSNKPLSYPVIYVVLGFLLYKLPVNLPSPLPHLNSRFVVHLTEFCVIVSLAGVGLKIDRPLKWKYWRQLFQLLIIAMIVSFTLFAAASYLYVGFTIAGAVLLAAALSPTDPVLAADVQVGPPGEEEEQKDKFLLTAEAGFNDGLAFPLVFLAILLATLPDFGEVMKDWLVHKLLYKLSVGIIGGWLLGLIFRRIFVLFQRIELTNVSDGFVSLALTLLTYGIIEIAGGYGFLSVFIGALIFSRNTKSHSSEEGVRFEFRKELHNFTDQLERLLIVVILFLFGAIISAGLFDYLSWKGVVAGTIFIFIIRPLAGWLSLIGTSLNGRQKWLVSFFGIRGVGSLFYLSFGLSHVSFAADKSLELWAVAAYTILLSVFVHGILAYPATKWAQQINSSGCTGCTEK